MMETGGLGASEQTWAVLCGGLNMLRCFSETSIPTIVVSPQADDVTFYSRYCERRAVIADPAGAPDRAAEDLLLLADHLPHRPVLFYGNDATLLLISRNRDRLAARYRFLMPPSGLIEALVDKARFAALAAGLGLPVPQTVLSGDVSGPEDILERLSLPCIFKPRVHIGWSTSMALRGHGGRPYKALRADTPDEVRARYRALAGAWPDFIVQEYVPGGDDCIYSFHAYLDERSEPLGYYVGRKIRTYPRDAGVSTYLELVDEPELCALGLDVLSRLDFTGVVKIDFKRDPVRGAWFILELNPRYNLWNYLGAACGVNLLQIAYDHLLGRPVSLQKDHRTGVRWLSFGDDLRAFVRDYARDGDLTLFDWLLSLRGDKVYNVFEWRDPVSLAVSTARYCQALGKRLARRALP